MPHFEHPVHANPPETTDDDELELRAPPQMQADNLHAVALDAGGEPLLRAMTVNLDAEAARVGDLADRVRQVRSLFFGRARGRPRGGVESVMASF